MLITIENSSEQWTDFTQFATSNETSRERQDINDTSPGHIKDHELKAIRLSAHKNIKIERKTAQERPRAEGLTSQESP